MDYFLGIFIYAIFTCKILHISTASLLQDSNKIYDLTVLSVC